MFCMSCGAQNNDTAQFCAKCGKPLTSSAQAAPTAVASSASVASQQVAQNYGQTASQQQYGQAQGQAYGQPYSQTPMPYGAPAPVEGCLGAGWKDITSTPGWFKRVLMLCLVNIVPILGPFATNGYCLRWARDLSFGKREAMPKRIFRKHEIATGFKAFLVEFMLGAIYGIVALAAIALVAGLFALINVIAGLVMLVILLVVVGIFTLLFVAPAIVACEMRLAVTGVLEKGLNVKVVWDTFRKAMGSCIASAIVPGIVVGIVSFIVTAIINALTTAIIAGAVTGMARGAYYGSSYGSNWSTNMLYSLMNGNIQGLISLFTGTALIMLFIFLLIYVISCLFNLFASLWSYRAMGHWAARNAPEWAAESEEGTLDSLQEDSLMEKQAFASAGLSGYQRPFQ